MSTIVSDDVAEKVGLTDDVAVGQVTGETAVDNLNVNVEFQNHFRLIFVFDKT